MKRKTLGQFSRQEKGFTLLEIIVSLGIFAVLVVGILSAYTALTTAVKAAREKTILASLASNYLEVVRNMPFADVGTLNGNPPGTLADLTNAIEITREGIPYKIFYEVTYVDDPADGTIGGTPNDPAPADYKQVKMSIRNENSGQVTHFVTNVAPKGLEGTTNAGALKIKVFNVAGQPIENADIHIEYPVSAPTVILDRKTNADGEWIEVGLPEATNSYSISATKLGHTTDQTDLATAQNPNPTKPHATVVNGQVTNISFSIDLPSALSIRTVNQFCQNTSGVELNIHGERLLGTSPDVYRFNQDFTSAAGEVALTDIEWDTYLPTLLVGQSWVIRGTSPVQKIDVLPGTSQTFTMVLAPTTPDSGGSDPDPAWYYEDWGYRRKVTVDNARVSGSQNLTDFPMLFSATANEFRHVDSGGKVGKMDGTDLLFTAADGQTKLAHELEYYNPATGQVIAWVRVPTLLVSSDTELLLYYGNTAAADQQNIAGVWDSGYQAVWHLKNGSTLSAEDSTSHDEDGTINGASATSGVIDGAANFNDDEEHINFGDGDVDVSGTGLTMQMWVRRSSGSTAVLLDKERSNSPTGGYALEVNSSSRPFFRIRNDSGGNASVTSSVGISNGTNAMIAATYNGSNLFMYINGVQRGTAASTLDIASTNVDLGVGHTADGSGSEFNGRIDEVRISNVARSSDWLRTEYNNHNSPLTFYTIETEEAYAAPTGIDNSLLVIVKDAATGTPLEGAQMTFTRGATVYDGVTGGSVWVQNSWEGGAGQELWSPATSDRYAQNNGLIDTGGVPSGVRLTQVGADYVGPGWLESSVFDSGTPESQYTTILWEPATQELDTELTFQIASSNDELGPWDYMGPDGTSATYYTSSGSNIHEAHDSQRYIRYKAYLATSDASKTPILTAVKLNYVSGCATPGQYWFGELTSGNHTLEVIMPGYDNANEVIFVNNHQNFEVLMNPQ